MLDPDAQKMLDMARKAGRPPFETMTPEEARVQVRAMREMLKQVPPHIAEVRNLTAPGPHGPIPLRLYRARPAKDGAPQPGVVYFHGGGWLFGDLDTHDNLCRHLAQAAEWFPLLGLLGTVAAILQTFSSITGTVTPKEIITKYAPAITATGSGLFMALVNILPTWTVLVGRELILTLGGGEPTGEAPP